MLTPMNLLTPRAGVSLNDTDGFQAPASGPPPRGMTDEEAFGPAGGDWPGREVTRAALSALEAWPGREVTQSVPARGLTDEEVFGAPPGSTAPIRGLTDEEVFGNAPAPIEARSRLGLNIEEGFRGTLAGEARERVISGQVASRAGQEALRAAEEAEAAGSPYGLENSRGAPSAYAGIPVARLRALGTQALEEGARRAETFRSEVLPRRAADAATVPAWNADGNVRGAPSGLVALMGQLIGGAGSPESYVGPAGSRLLRGAGEGAGAYAGRQVAENVLPNAVAGAGVNVPTQTGEIERGQRSDYSPGETLAAGAMGSLFGAAFPAGAETTRALAQSLARAVSRQRGGPSAPGAGSTNVTAAELDVALQDPAVLRILEANGIGPGDPRAVMLERRLAARREAEAARAGAPEAGAADPSVGRPAGLPDNRPGEGNQRFDQSVMRDRARTEAEAERAAEVPPAPPEQRPAPRAETMAVTRDGQAFPDTEGARVGQDHARGGRQIVPVGAAYDPRIGGDQAGPRAGAEPLGEETISRLARIEERLNALQGRQPGADPSGYQGAPDFTAPGARPPQTPEQAASQRDARGAFDLAEAQRTRDATAPTTRDTQTATGPTRQGPQRVSVLLDDGYPVRIVRDLGNGNVSVERYDPRTREATGSAYTTQRRGLNERDYTLNPRAAQDFTARSQGPVVNEGGARGRNADDALGLERQTFRVVPDDPADTPRTSRGEPGEPYTPRSPRPEQPAGEAPGGGGSRSERRFRTAEEAEAAFRARENARRAREEASGESTGGRRAPPPGEDAKPTSNKEAAPVAGRYPVDAGGHVLSDKGGAIRFGSQMQAARWIIGVGQKNSVDQIFEIANHPTGSGFTVQVRGHTDAPQETAGPRNQAEQGVSDLVTQMQRTGGATPKGERTLSAFIRQQGGIRDDGGDVRSMDVQGVGITNRNGLSADEMAQRAHEAGYFPEKGPDGMVTERDLFNALERETNQRAPQRGSTEDGDARATMRAEADLAGELADTPASIHDSPETILAALRERDAARRAEEHADAAERNAVRGQDDAPAAARDDADDIPFYANPVADPAAWKRYVGEPLGAAMRAVASGARGPADVFRALTYTADGELRATRSANASAAYRVELDGMHATVGEGGGVGRTFDEAVFKGVNENLLRVQSIQDAMNTGNVSAADLRAVMTGGTPSRPVPNSIVSDTRDFLARLLKLQRDAGVDVGDVGRRYFPRQYDTGAIFGSPNAEHRFLKAVEREYSDPAGPGLDRTSAREAAVSLLTTLKNSADGLNVDGVAAGRGNAMNTKGREFAPAADRRLSEFYVQDVARVLGGYALRSVRRAEIARRYGEPQHTIDGVILPKLDQRMATMLDEGASVRDLAKLRAYVGTATGVSTPRTPRPLDWLRTWATLGNLNTSLFINLSEMLIPAVRAGNLGGALKDVSRSLNQFQREIRNLPREEAGLLAERLGVIAGREHNTIMQARFGAGDVQDRAMAHIQSKFFRGIGMEQLTTATRSASAERGTEFIRDMSLAALGERKFAGLFGDQNRARFYLRELGVKAGTEEAFARWVKGAHGADYPSELLGSAEGQAWQTAVGRFVDQTSLRPTASTRPRWASHPYGSILFNLSSYPYAFGKQVIGRAINLGTEAATGKGYTPVERVALLAPVLLPLAGFAAAQVALQNARTMVYGDPEVERRKTDNRRLQDVAERSGMLGGAQPWLNLLGAARFGVAQQAAGPAAGMPLQLINALVAQADQGNRASTNTSERTTAKTAFRTIVEPGANLAASLFPGTNLAAGAVRGASLLVTGLPAVRDGFVDGVAGPQSARSRRDTRNRPIYGLGDSLPSSVPTRHGIPVERR